MTERQDRSIPDSTSDRSKAVEKQMALSYMAMWTPEYIRLAEEKRSRDAASKPNFEADYTARIVERMIFQLAMDAMPEENRKPLPELKGPRYAGQCWDPKTGWGINMRLLLGTTYAPRSLKEAIWLKDTLGATIGLSHDCVGRIPQPKPPKFVGEILKMKNVGIKGLDLDP